MLYKKLFISVLSLVVFILSLFIYLFYISYDQYEAKITISKDISNKKADALNVQNLDEFIVNIPKLEVGDVILRHGVDKESYLIAKVSQSNYSHVAIIAAVNPIVIIHATTNDDVNHPNQIIQSSLKEFLKEAINLAVLRYDLNDSSKEHISKFLYSQLGKPFSFDEGGVYCSLLVKQALEPYTKLNLSIQAINILGLKKKLIMPQAFFDDANNTKVFISN